MLSLSLFCCFLSVSYNGTATPRLNISPASHVPPATIPGTKTLFQNRNFGDIYESIENTGVQQ
jgi:hypothetical protein